MMELLYRSALIYTECCGQEILNSICRIYVAEISAAICNNEMLFCQKREIAAAGARSPLLAFTKMMVSCSSGLAQIFVAFLLFCDQALITD